MKNTLGTPLGTLQKPMLGGYKKWFKTELGFDLGFKLNISKYYPRPYLV